MIIYIHIRKRRVKRDEIRRSSRWRRGKKSEREIRDWKSVVGNLEEADCLELRKIPFIDPRGEIRLLRLFLLASLEPSLLVPFSPTSVRDHVSAEDDNKSGNKLFNTFHFGPVARPRGDSTALQGCLSPPPNLKFLIKVIADRGFLSASWISSPFAPPAHCRRGSFNGYNGLYY